MNLVGFYTLKIWVPSRHTTNGVNISCNKLTLFQIHRDRLCSSNNYSQVFITETHPNGVFSGLVDYGEGKKLIEVEKDLDLGSISVCAVEGNSTVRGRFVSFYLENHDLWINDAKIYAYE